MGERAPRARVAVDNPAVKAGAEKAEAGMDMAGSAHRVTHLPPRCDRAYRRNRNESVAEVRQLRRNSSTGSLVTAPRAGSLRGGATSCGHARRCTGATRPATALAAREATRKAHG